MPQKANIKIFSALLLASFILTLFIVVVNAQEEVQQENFDLQVSQSVAINRLSIGSEIELTILITNTGPESASQVFFNVTLPAQFGDVTYDFGSLDTIARPDDPNAWFIDQPIPANQTIPVTVTALMARYACDIGLSTVAEVALGNNRVDLNPANNQAEQHFIIRGESRCTYLPLIRRDPSPTPTATPTPTPTLIPTTLTPTPTPTPTPSPTPRPTLDERPFYYESFNDDDDDDDWPEGSTADCRFREEDDKYEVEARGDDDDDECFSPAPRRAERVYGAFIVDAYRDSDDAEDFAYGLYINGRGGDYYYMLRVFPNTGSCRDGGDWELLRQEDDDGRAVTGRRCDPVIRRGEGSRNTNRLAIDHRPNGTLIIYINEREVGRYTDNRQLTRGRGTGVYVRRDDEDVVVKFDNFTVYRE